MQVVRAPHPALRVKTKKVLKISPALLKTIKEMEKKTKTFTDPEGVGLASTQIGENEQYFIAKIDERRDKRLIAKMNDKTFKAFFNPMILQFSKQQKSYFEGCLSIPDFYGYVKRSLWIKVKYMDDKGKVVEEKLTGVPAWIFQHEFDHLQGKLFMDLVLEQKGRLFQVTGRDRAGAEIFEEVGL